MSKERRVREETITVAKCERCGKQHTFPIEIIFDSLVNVMGLFGYKQQSQDVVLVCPKTGKNIVVSVPVTLTTLQTLVKIQPKG